MSPTAADILKSVVEVLLAIGGLSGLITVFVSKRKSDAEADAVKASAKKTGKETSLSIPADSTEKIVNSSGDVIEQYRTLLADYQKETDRKLEVVKAEQERREMLLARCAKRITYLMTGIQMLTEQLISARVNPCWSPDNWDLEPPTNVETKG
jgi:hypothetical protein